ncbi:MAG: type VI secretion system tip protein VgrG, partial [bacterium]|nr:type VI secretion system tip protein VgrG [bacterium]
MSKAQLAFQILGADVDQFSVIRYRGTEGLCQLYRFEIELERAYGEADLNEIIGNAAVLSINTARGERWFHGIISRFELMDESYDRSYFRAELVPTVWMLTHRYGSRIFQNKTTPEIIQDVLTRAGIDTDRFRMDVLERDYEPREYCVQYRETDYNFIARLMEDEGIWWHFEQTQESHVLVLADSPSGYKPIEGNPALPFRPPSGMVTDTHPEAEHVHRFRLGGSVRCDGVSVNDYNFKNPKLDLRAGVESGDKIGEFVDYPGRH